MSTYKKKSQPISYFFFPNHHYLFSNKKKLTSVKFYYHKKLNGFLFRKSIEDSCTLRTKSKNNFWDFWGKRQVKKWDDVTLFIKKNGYKKGVKKNIILKTNNQVT